MSDTKTKEPGQVHWEASQVFDERTIPWSEVDEDEKEKSRQIEAACREGFVPQPIVDAVMRWRHGTLSGDVELAEDAGQEVIARAIRLVLGKKQLARCWNNCEMGGREL